MRQNTLSMIISLWIGSLGLSAQDFSKDNSPGSPNRTVRAVIVGVAKYPKLDPRTNLSFADKDALDFKRFLLQSGLVDNPKNIRMFVEKDAVSKERIIDSVFNYFIEVAGKNDLTIFYFSGHGDVQIRQNRPRGYLLLRNVNAPDASTYAASDAIDIDHLKRETEGPAVDGKKILVIIDACRKDKLVSTKENAQIVGESLATWHTKIMQMISCSEKESSFESSKHENGLFTHFLIKGLEGDAESPLDKDDLVSFAEIQDHLNRSFPPHGAQHPQLYNNDASYLLSKVISKKNNDSSLDLAQADFRTFTDKSTDTRNLPPDLIELTDRFIKSIEYRTLLKPIHIPEPDDEREFAVESTLIRSNASSNTNDIAFSPTESEFVSVEEDGTFRIWDAASSKPIFVKKLDGTKGNRCVAYSPDGRYIAIGTYTPSLVIVAGPEWTERSRTTADVRSVAFSKDGKHLASGSKGGIVQLWTTIGWEKTKGPLKLHTGNVMGLAFVNQDSTLISIGGKEIVFFDMITGTQTTRRTMGQQLVSLAEVPSKQYVYAMDDQATIYKVDVKEMSVREIKSIRRPKSEAFAIDANQKFVFTGTWGRQEIEIRPLKSDSISIPSIKGEHSVRSIILSRGNNRLLACMYYGAIIDAKFDIPPPREYAYDLYNFLKLKPSFSEHSGGYNSALIAAIEFSTGPLVEDFIMGKENLPSTGEIKEAIRRQELALQLASNDQWKKKRIQNNLNLLQVIEIVQTNNFDKLQDAVTLIEKVIKSDPYEAYTYNTLSVIYKKLNKMKEARQSATSASTKAPGWVGPIINLGWIAFSEGKYKEAIAKFNQVTVMSPRLPHGYENLAEAYLRLGSFRLADENLILAFARDSSSETIRVKQIALAAARGNIDRRTYYNNPINYSYQKLISRGDLESLGRSTSTARGITRFTTPVYFTSALPYYEKAAKQSPEAPEAYQRQAWIYISFLSSSDTSLSIEQFGSQVQHDLNRQQIIERLDTLAKKSLQYAPYDPDSYAAVAYQLYFQSERQMKYQRGVSIDKVKKKFEEAIEKMPNHGKSYYNFANYLLTRREYSDAEKHLRMGLKVDKNYLPLYDLVGTLYLATDRAKTLNNFYLKAAKEIDFAKTPLLYYYLAKHLAESDMPNEHAIELARSADPEFYYTHELR